jgi:YaiO family outer membrane protein
MIMIATKDLRRHVLALATIALVAVPALAQETPGDILVSARQAATSGRRPEALNALSAHLVTSPRDVDARLLYGLVLSWEGRYDEARQQLRQVLEQTPAYTDARIALMNVDWWSGRVDAARDAADSILARDPGNTQARFVRERLEAAAHPWWAGASYANDTFSDDRDAWHESAFSVTRQTPRGSLIFRASDARRFGSGDQLLEVEFYPRIRPGTYAFVSVGGAPDATLYPSTRIAFDLYQSIGHGVEVSGGMRRLGFDSTTYIYVGTVSKYVGNWMLTGKVFRVPAEGDLDSTSYHGGFRRYVRGDGASYVGLTYSHGFSREEIRNVGDLTTLDADTVRFEADQLIARRFRLSATIGTSRQQRQSRDSLWQTSVGGGLMVLF